MLQHLSTTPHDEPTQKALIGNVELEQAQINYYNNIAAWYKLMHTLTLIYITLSIVVPIVAFILSSIFLWIFWTIGDALLRALLRAL